MVKLAHINAVDEIAHKNIPSYTPTLINGDLITPQPPLHCTPAYPSENNHYEVVVIIVLYCCMYHVAELNIQICI